MKRLAILACGMLLAACSVLQPARPAAEEPDPVRLQQMPERIGVGGGVFVPDAPWTLTSDSRAFRPGDVLTVMLSETTQASKSADTKYGKTSSASITPPTVLGHKYSKIDFSADASRDFNGSATSTQQNTLQGAITVIVEEVLPNGLLRIRGEKTLNLNQGDEFVRLSGYVRAGDIDSDNRVSSQRVANARIAYSGRGAVHDSNEPGWLMKFFTSSWMPF